MTENNRLKQYTPNEVTEWNACKTAKWNGPRTSAGRQRIAQAQLKHGAYSKAGLAAKHAEAIQLRQLEDMAYVTGLIQGPRTRGCKPRGYSPITSMEDVKALLHLNNGSNDSKSDLFNGKSHSLSQQRRPCN